MLENQSGTRTLETNSHEKEWSFYGRSSAFVGRVKELHALRESMRHTIEVRKNRLTLLIGGQGLGKSRLLSEFCDTLEAHVGTVTVVHARCPSVQGPPYALICRLLRNRFYVNENANHSMAFSMITQGLQGLLGDQARGEKAAKNLGEFCGLCNPSSTERDDENHNANKAFNALLECLRVDARKAPLCIVADDLHIVSDETLRFLLELVQALRDEPIFFVFSANSTFIGRLESIVNKPRQRPIYIPNRRDLLELPPLSDRDSRRLCQMLLAPCKGDTEPLIESTLEKAMGNPLSIEQILQLHLERGAIDPETWEVHPEALEIETLSNDLHVQVTQRLTRLSPLERSILEKASVFGDSFQMSMVDMLRRIDESHSWSEDERYWSQSTKQEELSHVLQGLWKRHILTRRAISQIDDETFSFRHEVEREVLYAGIEPKRRAHYHRLCAEKLATEQAFSEIAVHYDLGERPHQAALAYLAAADQAAVRHALGDARNFYQLALERLDPDNLNARISIYHGMGQVHRAQGNLDEADQCFRAMLDLAWQLNDLGAGGLAYNKLGQIARIRSNYDQALEYLKRGLALFRQIQDQRGIAASCDDIGRLHHLRGALDLAEERCEEGLRIRRDILQDPRSQAVSMHHLSNVFLARGDFAKAQAYIQAALVLARQYNDLRTEAELLLNQGLLAYQLGQFEKAAQIWNEALALTRNIGERQLEGVLLNHLGEVLLNLKQFDESTVHLQEAAEILESIGDRRSLTSNLRNRGVIYFEKGDYQKALELCRSALALARDLGVRAQAAHIEVTLADIYSRTLYGNEKDRGDIARAASHFTSALNEFQILGLEADLARTYLSYGAFLAELGELDEAQTALVHAHTLAETLNLSDVKRRAARILEAI